MTKKGVSTGSVIGVSPTKTIRRDDSVRNSLVQTFHVS